MSDSKVRVLYQDIVGQMEKRADAKIASKKVAKAKYFGVVYKSYGIKEQELRELINSYLNKLKQLSLEERFHLVKMLYTSGFSEQVNFGDTILQLCVEELTPCLL